MSNVLEEYNRTRDILLAFFSGIVVGVITHYITEALILLRIVPLNYAGILGALQFLG